MKTFKLLPRLIISFGLTIMFGVSGWCTTNTDIKLLKTAPASVAANAPLVYTLTVSNVSSPAKNAGSIQVVDTLPSGVAYVSGSGTDWSCSASGQVITCTYSQILLAGNNAPALTINTTAPNTAGSKINNATVAMTNTSSSNGYSDTDTTNNSATATTTIVTPSAVNDSYSILNTYPLSANVLTNDTGVSIYVFSHTSPAHGTLTMALTGAFTYTPTAVYTGSDSFTYTIKDSAGNSSTATVSLTISAPGANTPPLMGDVPNQDIVKGVAFTLNIASYATATDTPILSYHVASGTLPPGLSLNQATGVISGIPTTNGTYTLSVNAQDAGGASNSDSLTITVSTVGVASDLLIIKTPSMLYTDVNQSVRYIITLANETSTALTATINDVLKTYNYNTTTGITGSEVLGKDLNISIVNSGSFNCGTVLSTASSFSCTGTVPKRTGNGGVPGLVRIIYTITTPSSPVPALLYNKVTINGTSTEANVSVIVGTTGGGGTPTTPPPDHADVIDTDMWTGITDYNSGISKVIKTKISAKTGMPISAVHLDGAGAAHTFTAVDPDLTFLVIPYISDGMCSTQEILYDTDTGLPAVLNITTGNATATANVTMPAYARKNTRISISYLDLDQLKIDSGVKCAYTSSTVGNLAGLGQCVNSANNYYDAFGLSAYERCQTLNGNPCSPTNHGKSCNGQPNSASCTDYNALYDNDLGCLMCTLNLFPDCSSDNFAIRPNKLDINSSHVDMPNLLRSAQDYNTTIKALDYNSVTNNTLKYDVTDAHLIYAIAPTTTKYLKTNAVSTTMAGTASFASSGFNMLDGLSVKSGVAGNEVAGLTFDDVGKINISIQDQDWSAVDINNIVDTTPHDCSVNGAYVCGDKNVTFIPEHFDFNELNITNNNGNPGSFTYIANEFTQMGGRIHAQMRALNKNGNVTQNFAAYPLWENNMSVTPVVRVATATYLYPDANETNITNLTLGFGTGTDANGTKRILWDETNTSKYLRFNFPRDVNPVTPPNPFDANGADLNISASSIYVDGGNQATISGSRNGTGNGTSRFLYGRIIPRDIRVFGTSSGVIANAWYEVYKGSPIGVTALPQSKNAVSWFTNILHVDPSDGDANVTQLQTGAAGSTALTPSIGITPTFGGIETYNFTSLGLGIGGYKAHIDTDPWLWYGINALPYVDPVTGNTEAACLTHPCFNINVVPAVGATGSAKSTNEATKESKRSTGGGGGWRSTTDYAPAVR